MALYKDYYFILDTKRSPRIALQNIVAGETGNRLHITLTNDDSPVALASATHRVCLRVDSALGTRRQDSSLDNSGISFDSGNAVILLSKDSYTGGMNRCTLEVYTTASDANDTLICSAEFQFVSKGEREGENAGSTYPSLIAAEEDAREATTDANNAASAASAAAESATSAASSANSAASSANSAASAANTAAAAATAAAKRNHYLILHDPVDWTDPSIGVDTDDTWEQLMTLADDVTFTMHIVKDDVEATLIETQRFYENGEIALIQFQSPDTIYDDDGTLNGRQVFINAYLEPGSGEKGAIETWIDSNLYVRENNLGGAKLGAATLVQELAQTSVTTEDVSYYDYPLGVIMEQNDPDNLYRGYMYRITFDGVTYELPCLEWFVRGTFNGEMISSVFGFVGNIALYGVDSGFYTNVYDVPFLLCGLISTPTDFKHEGLFLFTEDAGTHTVTIRRVEYASTQIPNELLYKSEIRPIYRTHDAGYAYPFVTVGANSMKNRRNSWAFGNTNEISGSGYMAIGGANVVSGQHGMAIGHWGDVSGQWAKTFGYQCKASAKYAIAQGTAAEASGQFAMAFGLGTIANHKNQMAFGVYNVADPSSAAATSRGNYLEIVGNGTSKTSRSNARTLDFDGNESLAGGLTLGKGGANEASLTAALLKALVSGGSTGHVLTRTANGFEWAALPVYSGGVS